MVRTLRPREVVGVILWAVLTLTVSVSWIARAQQAAPQTGNDPRFTGATSTLDAAGVSVSRRRFEAGARSAWHSHAQGQLLFVQEGRARTQRRGQTVKDLGPGESDYTPPGVPHWHGAVPGEAFVQVAVGFGGETTWMDKVTDGEYAGPAR